jgi:hypothetical protein
MKKILQFLMNILRSTTPEEPVKNDFDDFVLVTTTAQEEDIREEDISDVMSCPLYPHGGAEAERLSRFSYALAKQNSERAYAESRLKEMGYHYLRFLGARTLRSQHGIIIIAMIKPNSSEPINIVCRGTSLDASIITDLEPRGPGFTPMQTHIDELLHDIEGLAQLFPDRAMRVMGHSLGGALAQLITSYFLEQRACAQHTDDKLNEGEIVPCQFPQLKKVNSLETVLFQSAGVNEDVAKQAADWACIMRVLNPSFSMSLLANVRQGDVVSRTGEYIFSNIDPNIVKVSLHCKPLKKPLLTPKGVLSFGCVAMLSSGAPFPIVSSAVYGLLSCYVKHTIQAHRETIFWKPDAQPCTQLSPECYGVLTNVSEEDRPRIFEVFNESLLRKMPMLHPLHNWLFEFLKPLNNEDVTVLVSIFKAIPDLVEVARRGIDNPLTGFVLALEKFSVLHDVHTHGSEVVSVVKKLGSP